MRDCSDPPFDIDGVSAQLKGSKDTTIARYPAKWVHATNMPECDQSHQKITGASSIMHLTAYDV